jgi:Zn-dependent protease
VSILQRFNDDPLGAVVWAVALLLSVTLHEYGHAWAAIWMGDDTPKVNGRFSWNPLRYLDPIGIGMFLLIGFGALGSVRTRPDLYRNRVLGEVVVSSAGIVMNLVLVGVAAVLIRTIRAEPSIPDWAFQASYELFRLNVVLAVFNAFPIPPLDGSRVLAAITPGALGESLRAYLHAPSSSFLLLFAIVALNQPIGKLLSDAVRFAVRLLL